jgi:flagellar hook protein FlgE
MNWNLANTSGAGAITQYSQPSSLASSTQDGAEAAQLTQVAIQNGGQVVATFSNGQQKVEGQLALAAIQNPGSLQNVGNNNFAATAETAAPAIGMPQTSGRGQILGGSLEGSNVDMATEFTNLIVYQSAYQASSRVISTADNMTQDLMNLIH